MTVKLFREFINCKSLDARSNTLLTKNNIYVDSIGAMFTYRHGVMDKIKIDGHSTLQKLSGNAGLVSIELGEPAPFSFVNHGHKWQFDVGVIESLISDEEDNPNNSNYNQTYQPKYIVRGFETGSYKSTY